jgi:hypothetical protein
MINSSSPRIYLWVTLHVTVLGADCTPLTLTDEERLINCINVQKLTNSN